MGQVTIYLDDETEKLVKRYVKKSGGSMSKWIADAVRKQAMEKWPVDVLALLGSWKDDDFPEARELRAAYGVDVPREEF